MFAKVFVVILCCVAAINAQTDYCPDETNAAVAPCVDFFCQNPDLTNGFGALLPTATVCSNELSDANCEALFPCEGYLFAQLETQPGRINDATHTATASGAGTICSPEYTAATGEVLQLDPPQNLPMVRNPACGRPELRDTALQCARQCAMCCETPEYSCEDDDNSPIDCQLNRNKCTVANWTNIMAQYCPQTCGLCTSGTCLDWNPGCADLAGLCRNVDWVDYMETHCARTCGTCTTSSPTSSPGGCSNIASNCAENANLCTNTIYRDLMLQQCCATCSGSSGGVSCTDSSSSCGNWVPNGFCSSTFYTRDQKRQYCARSCNLC